MKRSPACRAFCLVPLVGRARDGSGRDGVAALVIAGVERLVRWLQARSERPFECDEWLFQTELRRSSSTVARRRPVLAEQTTVAGLDLAVTDLYRR